MINSPFVIYNGCLVRFFFLLIVGVYLKSNKRFHYSTLHNILSHCCRRMSYNMNRPIKLRALCYLRESYTRLYKRACKRATARPLKIKLIFQCIIQLLIYLKAIWNSN